MMDCQILVLAHDYLVKWVEAVVVLPAIAAVVSIVSTGLQEGGATRMGDEIRLDAETCLLPEKQGD